MNDRIYKGQIDRLREPERTNRLEIEKVVDLCLEEKGIKTLLDIGTGSGLFAEAFSKAGLLISGIDINEEMLTAAREYLPKCDFQIAPAENIPYGDKSFDAAFFGMVFHEVSDYKKALSEAFRVSKNTTLILEWQYEVQDFGPPLEHRLSSEFIKYLAKEVGYTNISEIRLSNLVLYKFS